MGESGPQARKGRMRFVNRSVFPAVERPSPAATASDPPAAREGEAKRATSKLEKEGEGKWTCEPRTARGFVISCQLFFLPRVQPMFDNLFAHAPPL